MAVLKTLLSPNCSASVAASLKTPPSLRPTSCPYKTASGKSSMISLIANKAASTITIFSLPAGDLSPFSSVIFVGAKTCSETFSTSGSGALTAC